MSNRNNNPEYDKLKEELLVIINNEQSRIMEKLDNKINESNMTISESNKVMEENKRIIECFLEQKIPVGVYFYSYANSIEKAKKDALWVIEQIKDYDVTLPIAFDWENWSSFNKFGISFKTLSECADTFIKTLKDKGYSGVLYSSKNYLEKIWNTMGNDVWLAHYTEKTDYEGDYMMWQLTSGGVIPGITDNTVDVDILYRNN